MSPIKLTALLTFAGTLAVASLCVAAYEAVRPNEMTAIAATAPSNADATQRQYLASLEYRITRLEEGTQEEPSQGNNAPAEDEPVDNSSPAYRKGMLHAEQRLQSVTDFSSGGQHSGLGRRHQEKAWWLHAR